MSITVTVRFRRIVRQHADHVGSGAWVLTHCFLGVLGFKGPLRNRPRNHRICDPLHGSIEAPALSVQAPSANQGIARVPRLEAPPPPPRPRCVLAISRLGCLLLHQVQQERLGLGPCLHHHGRQAESSRLAPLAHRRFLERGRPVHAGNKRGVRDVFFSRVFSFSP